MNRNVVFLRGEDGVFVKHGRAHVGKLAQFGVGNVGDRLRIANDARIGHQESGNIGPVFVDICFHDVGQNGTGHIAAAARRP